MGSRIHFQQISFAILLATSFLFHTSGFAQENILFIGVSGSYEDLGPTFSEDNSLRSDIDFFGYSIMGTLKFDTEKRLRLETAIGYSQKIIEYSYSYIFIDFNDPSIPNRTRLNHHFVRVPILVGIRTLRRNFDIVPCAGLQFEFLVNTSEKTIYEDGSERVSDYSNGNHSSMWFNLRLDIGFEYLIVKKVKANLTPTVFYRVFGKSEQPDTGTTDLTLDWGFNLGFFYAL